MEQKIMYIGAHSSNTNINKEINNESKAIRELMDANDSKFEIDVRPVGKISEVSDAIQRKTPPQIIHISGHATEKGEIDIVDEQYPEKGEYLKPDDLVKFLKNAGNVNCVLLNFCYSKKAADLIAEEAQNIGCVIGVNGDISSTAAVDFSKAFYKSLQGEILNNQSVVKEAFDKGKAAASPTTKEDTYNIFSPFGDVTDSRFLDRNFRENNINIWLDKSDDYITLNWSITDIYPSDYVALYDHSPNGDAKSYLKDQWQWTANNKGLYRTDRQADGKAYWIAYGGKVNGDDFIKAENGPFLISSSLEYVPDSRLLDRTSRGNNINIWLDKSDDYITLNWLVTEIYPSDYVALYDHSPNGDANSYLKDQWQWTANNIAVPIQMRYKIILRGVGARHCRALTGVPHVNENRYKGLYRTNIPADSKAYWIAYGGKVNGNYFIKAQNGPFFL